MENLTIGQIAGIYDVTPRMLRHYEKLGLLHPLRREDSAYRVYDENAVRRLQQIVILRKLRIPLKQIAVILQDREQRRALELLQENLVQLEDEISSLNKIRELLKELVSQFDKGIRENLAPDLLEDSALVQAIGALALPKTTIKESVTMSDLNKANETLDKSLNVRILLLPPCTVAAYRFVGANPEEAAGDVVSKFVQESGLYEIKPDARMFGFNHPNPGILENGLYGYEEWVTIPEEMEVAEPMTKKKFAGGLYAVLTIQFPEFEFWEKLTEWAENNEVYEPDYSELGLEIMGGCLEEHLNWVYAASLGWPEESITGQLDLMLPIRRRDKKLQA